MTRYKKWANSVTYGHKLQRKNFNGTGRDCKFLKMQTLLGSIITGRVSPSKKVFLILVPARHWSMPWSSLIVFRMLRKYFGLSVGRTSGLVRGLGTIETEAESRSRDEDLRVLASTCQPRDFDWGHHQQWRRAGLQWPWKSHSLCSTHFFTEVRRRGQRHDCRASSAKRSAQWGRPASTNWLNWIASSGKGKKICFRRSYCALWVCVGVWETEREIES